jgi:hypothetical protein
VLAAVHCFISVKVILSFVTDKSFKMLYFLSCLPLNSFCAVERKALWQVLEAWWLVRPANVLAFAFGYLHGN